MIALQNGVVRQVRVVGIKLAVLRLENVGVVVVFAGEVAEVVYRAHVSRRLGPAVDEHLLNASGLCLARKRQRRVAPHVRRAEQPLEVRVLLQFLREWHDEAVLLRIGAVAFAERDVAALRGKVEKEAARVAERFFLRTPRHLWRDQRATALAGDLLQFHVTVVAGFQQQQIAGSRIKITQANPRHVEPVAAETAARERLQVERIEMAVAVIGHHQHAARRIEHKRLNETRVTARLC